MNNTIQPQARALGLDILKCLCAFLVVCIHAPFNGVFGEYFTVIARIAVPVFFMITGFFYEGTVKKRKEKAQIIKILKLMILSNLLYFCFNAALVCGKGFIASGISGAFDGLKSMITIKDLINLLLFNESPFGIHLWYLGAILYVLVIAFALNKFGKLKLLFFLTPLLLLTDLVLGKYSLLIFGREFDFLYVRNFLFVGIPYFAIGHLLSLKRSKAAKLFQKRLLLIPSIFICVLLSLAERYFLVLNNLNAQRDHYIFTTLTAVLVFIFFLTLSQGKFVSKLKFASIIGNKYSLAIYIIHPLLITFISKAMRILHLNTVYSLLAPIIVFVISLISVMLYYYFKNKFLKPRVEKN